MSSKEIVISARSLSKVYRLFTHPGDRVKQFLSFGLRRYHKEFTALQNISFDIRKGETVGIIGRNGAGKSTLLQLICGILKPTAGDVRVDGRVLALLELGAGFNPEFTGRENVFFQGALMGVQKAAMNRRFDDIVAFADIGEFIDQPVRMYSSGMFVRLAFSVAIHLDPEILIIDEALAVGDAGFQIKCFERIHQIRQQGGCILFVTHALEQVAHFCDRALLLDKGRLLFEGDTSIALARYDNCSNTGYVERAIGCLPRGAEDQDTFQYHRAYNPQETRWGDRAATICEFHLLQDGDEDPSMLSAGLPVELRLSVRFHSPVVHPVYGLTIKSIEGAQLFGTNSRILCGPAGAPRQQAGDRIDICFVFYPFLDAGDYFISVGISSDTPSGVVPHDRRYDAIKLRIEHPTFPSGSINMKPVFRILDVA